MNEHSCKCGNYLLFDVEDNLLGCIECEKKKGIVGGVIIWKDKRGNLFEHAIPKPFHYILRVMWLFNQLGNRICKYRYTEQFIPKHMLVNNNNQ